MDHDYVRDRWTLGTRACPSDLKDCTDHHPGILLMGAVTRAEHSGLLLFISDQQS